MRVKRRVKRLAGNSTFKKLRSWHPILSVHGQKKGKKQKLQILFSWAPKSLGMVTAAMKCMVTAAMKLKDTCSLKKSYDKLK